MKKRPFAIVASILLCALSLSCMAACMPSNPDEVVTNLKEAGYTVTVVKDEDASHSAEYYLPDGCTAYITAYKEHELLTIGESIEVHYFKDKASASAYMKENEGWQNEINDAIVGYENDYRAGLIKEEVFFAMKEMLESSVMKQEGTIVYLGTAEAVKDAK